MIDIDKLYHDITSYLKEHLPGGLSYHSVEHTKYVFERVTYIASKEDVDVHHLHLLQIAALFHDIGFIKQRIDHEDVGCVIAREWLKNDLTAKEIDVVCGMIMATKIPQSPKTKYENILADADLEYLGTTYFEQVGELLYLELKYENDGLTRERWNDIQIGFISKHKYHTKFCRRYKEFRKRKNLAGLFEGH